VSTFEKYAHYYDLLYADKDYDAEAAFVADLICRHLPEATSVLEFGCGTGLHALALARRGYRVAGIDVSHDMLTHAINRLSHSSLAPEGIVSFDQGDVRTIRMEQRFDAVIALFHVMSYQTSADDLMACITTAAAHLRPGGVFVFDYWNGPAVLAHPPIDRIKRMEDETARVIRTAKPTMRPEDNVVEVSYDVLVENRLTGETQRVLETHSMRYLFEPELSRSLRNAGFERVKFGEWLTQQPAGDHAWSAYAVATALDGSQKV
jgi:SAM-dependent methyltransferase